MLLHHSDGINMKTSGVAAQEWADPPAWEMDEGRIDTGVLNRGAWASPPEEQPGGSRQPGGNGLPGGGPGSTGKKRGRPKGRKRERSSFSGAEDAKVADRSQPPRSRFKPQVKQAQAST